MLKVTATIDAGTYDEALEIAREDETLYGVTVEIVSKLHVPSPGFPAASYVDVIVSGPVDKVINALSEGWGMDGDEIFEGIIP